MTRTDFDKRYPIVKNWFLDEIRDIQVKKKRFLDEIWVKNNLFRRNKRDLSEKDWTKNRVVNVLGKNDEFVGQLIGCMNSRLVQLPQRTCI